MKPYEIALVAYVALMGVLFTVASHESPPTHGDCVTDYDCEVIHDL